MATWMQRRKGVIGVVAQQIRFGVSAALVEAESGVRSPSGLPEASIWLLRDVAFRVCLTSGQEPVPLLSRFRPVTNLSVATSTLRLRISPFVQGYLRALAFDLGAHIPPAPSAPSSPAHRRQSAHAHKRTDSMTSPLGPGRPAAARGLIHSVMGLQVAVESILLAMHTREGEPLPDMCTAGVRRLAVSLARDSQEVDFRASLQQVMREREESTGPTQSTRRAYPTPARSPEHSL